MLRKSMEQEYTINCSSCGRPIASCEHGNTMARITTRSRSTIFAQTFMYQCKCGFEKAYTTASGVLI